MSKRQFGTLRSAASLEPSTTVYSTDEEEVFCPTLVTENYRDYRDEVTGRLPPYYKSW